MEWENREECDQSIHEDLVFKGGIWRTGDESADSEEHRDLP